jgi:5-methylcytosine-specific restriction endonuclease McrA
LHDIGFTSAKVPIRDGVALVKMLLEAPLVGSFTFPLAARGTLYDAAFVADHWSGQMRPLDSAARNGVNSRWQPPSQWDFSRTRLAVAAQTEFGTPSPAVADCLDLWTRLIENPGGPWTRDQRDLTALVRSRVDQSYRGAVATVAHAYGLYCAYCEVPISDHVHVEHVIAKSEFPKLSLSLDNFLPACGPCNTRKSSAPSRATATALAASTSEAVLIGWVRAYYAWPDRTLEYRFLSPTLEHFDGTAWSAVSNPVDPALRLVSTPRVPPTEADIPGVGRARVRVRMLASASAPGALEIVDLVGLNDERPNDHRLDLRAEAWLNALAELSEEVPDPANPPSSLSEHLVRYAAESGFSAVWRAVAEQLNVAGPLETQLLSALPGCDTSRF